VWQSTKESQRSAGKSGVYTCDRSKEKFVWCRTWRWAEWHNQQIVQGNMLPLEKNKKTAQKFLSCRTATKPVFPSLSSMKDHLTQFFSSRGTLTHANAYGPLVTQQGVYRSYANCRTKISNIFWGMFGYCAVFSNLYVFIPPFLAKTLAGKHSSIQRISFIFKTHAFRLYISLSTFNVTKISNNTETIIITGS
jgi:hypothetical protein